MKFSSTKKNSLSKISEMKIIFKKQKAFIGFGLNTSRLTIRWMLKKLEICARCKEIL
jgi:hypothetical protein